TFCHTRRKEVPYGTDSAGHRSPVAASSPSHGVRDRRATVGGDDIVDGTGTDRHSSRNAHRWQGGRAEECHRGRGSRKDQEPWTGDTRTRVVRLSATHTLAGIDRHARPYRYALREGWESGIRRRNATGVDAVR